MDTECNPCIVIGVDPASTKLAFVALYKSQHITRFYNRIGRSGAEACSAGWEHSSYFVEFVRSTWPGIPINAFVEQPVLGRGGVRSTMVQSFTSGAVQGSLHSSGCDVTLANPSTWKKKAVGRGNATKEDISKWLRLRWPSLHAAAGGNQDLMDAAAIAIYGQLLLGQGMV